MPALGGFNSCRLDDPVAYFATRLGKIRHTITSALFILHVLSTCWGCEMNYEADRLARLIDECGALLEYVRAICPVRH